MKTHLGKGVTTARKLPDGPDFQWRRRTAVREVADGIRVQETTALTYQPIESGAQVRDSSGRWHVTRADITESAGHEPLYTLRITRIA
ncbi:MAG: hypothetical protein OXU75_09280 [Deltaproteobacteria bacterium]|nr:hypothetical protein [Deltaproteobacteria bacterium]